MLSYQEYEKAVYDALMSKRSVDRNFNFSVRQKALKGAEKDYFIGTEKGKYFGTTFWNIKIGFPGSAGDLINVFFIYISDNNFGYFFEFNQTNKPYNDQNKWALELIKSLEAILEKEIGLIKKSKPSQKIHNYRTKSRKASYKSIDELMTDVFKDAEQIIPIVNQQIKKIKSKHPEFKAHQFTDDEFEQMQNKLRKRLKLPTGSPGSSGNKKDFNPNPLNALPLNQILFGPPGTGKTYYLLENVIPMFEQKAATKPDEIVESELISKLPWWKIFALILLEKGKQTVPQIKEHRFVKYKLEVSNTNSLNQTVWGQLSSHTINESETVEYASRQGSLIFDKEEDSVWFIARSNDPVIDELNELLDEIGRLKDSSVQSQANFKFITFHQSTSYENFVEGITPKIDEETPEKTEQLSYEIKKGSFYTACDESAKLAGFLGLKDCLEHSKEERIEKFSNAAPYCLLIDEINRGNVSAILGELITLIEEDKRLTKNEIIVELPYSKNLFGVPPNLYIIGTMNTADRSVEALDTALRRRFSFTEMHPQPELLEPSLMLLRLFKEYAASDWDDPIWKQAEKDFFKLHGASIKNEVKYKQLESENDQNNLIEKFNDAIEFNGLNLRILLTTINLRIEKLLDRDHLIGHSYFIQVNCWDDLKQSFYRNIIPLLQEYFFGDYAKIGAVLGSGFIHREKDNDKEVFASGFENEDYFEKEIYQIIDYREGQPGNKHIPEGISFEKAIQRLMNLPTSKEIEE